MLLAENSIKFTVKMHYEMVMACHFPILKARNIHDWIN